MILGFEDLSIIATLLTPIYITQAINTVKLWKVRSQQKNCIYCQKSKKIFDKEVSMTLNEV